MNGQVDSTSAPEWIAVVDLDGTLCPRDTLWPLVVAAAVRRPSRILRVVSTFVRLPLLMRRDPSSAKEALLGAALGGLSIGELDRLAGRVADRLPLSSEVVARIGEHRAAGHAVWIASASVEPIVAAIARRIAADGYVATRLADDGARCTGLFAEGNCKGMEKLRRLDDVLPPDWRSRAVAFSDARADEPLMDAVATSCWTKRGRLLDEPVRSPSRRRIEQS